MNPAIIEITPGQLALAFLFVLAAGILSLVYGLKLERDLALGSIRTFVQLVLLGYLLKFIFNINRVWLVLTVFGIMIIFAALTIRGRVRERRVSFLGPVLISMLFSYFTVSFLVTAVVVAVKPWWTPQYFIPLAGMIVGNSVNAIAISLERLFSDLRNRRLEVEMMLCLGADYREASQDIFQNAIRAGMIPSINMMVAAGMVFIPGMMTGQILSGVDPMVAVYYQIVVMLMLVGSTAIGSLLVVRWVRGLCFGPGHQLLLKPEQ